jgi:hypothetical protein
MSDSLSHETLGLSEQPVIAQSFAVQYARALLDRIGHGPPLRGDADHPALAWRRAGLMDLTGRADRTGLMCPAPLASIADGVLLALKSLVPSPDSLPDYGCALLGERSRLLTLARRGRTSANGSCTLLDTMDGRLALNLARQDDWDCLAALFESPISPNWSAVAARTASRRSEEIV